MSQESLSLQVISLIEFIFLIITLIYFQMHATSVGKAGLPQNDLTKQKIAERVEELSKGSKFWQKKQEKLQQQTKDNSHKKVQLLSKLNDVDCRLKLQSAIELANDMKNTAATEISDQIVIDFQARKSYS